MLAQLSVEIQPSETITDDSTEDAWIRIANEALPRIDQLRSDAWNIMDDENMVHLLSAVIGRLHEWKQTAEQSKASRPE